VYFPLRHLWNYVWGKLEWKPWRRRRRISASIIAVPNGVPKIPAYNHKQVDFGNTIRNKLGIFFEDLSRNFWDEMSCITPANPVLASYLGGLGYRSPVLVWFWNQN
jgi:hypothetical protein